ncbi:hypothetical protein HK096_011046, partial [Nowakowskiella sp. JEL0078]
MASIQRLYNNLRLLTVQYQGTTQIFLYMLASNHLDDISWLSLNNACQRGIQFGIWLETFIDG